jgi:hypothetical protein
MSKLSITIDGRTFTVETPPLPRTTGEMTVQVDGQTVNVLVHDTGSSELLDWLIVEGAPLRTGYRSQSALDPLALRFASG